MTVNLDRAQISSLPDLDWIITKINGHVLLEGPISGIKKYVKEENISILASLKKINWSCYLT